MWQIFILAIAVAPGGEFLSIDHGTVGQYKSKELCTHIADSLVIKNSSVIIRTRCFKSGETK